MGEDWRLRGVAPAARSSGTAGPSAQDAWVLAVETLRTGERSRTFASAVSSMEQIEMSGSLDGPVAGAFHPSRHTKWRSASGRARDDFGSARAGGFFDQLDVPT